MKAPSRSPTGWELIHAVRVTPRTVIASVEDSSPLVGGHGLARCWVVSSRSSEGVGEDISPRGAGATGGEEEEERGEEEGGDEAGEDDGTGGEETAGP